MIQKVLDWISWHVYGHDPKVEAFLTEVAKKVAKTHHFSVRECKKNPSMLVDEMTDEELREFHFILRGCPEPDDFWDEDSDGIYDYRKLSKDCRVKRLFEQVENKIRWRRKQAKRQKFVALDWDNLELDEKSFKLSCEKEEMGVWRNVRIDIRANQIDGFPTHILKYSLIVCLNGEDVLLDDVWHNGVVCICTNEEETKWLKKHRTIVSFIPYIVEQPEALFEDDYYQQKKDKPKSLPEDTKQRIKDYLCGEECEDKEKNKFENYKLIKPILWVLVYNHLLIRKLALDKAHVAQVIKKRHLKEKMYYRLLHKYPLSQEKQQRLRALYRKYRKTSE